ncbi:MAG TPA: 6-phosphogluconolactonase [Chlamydiales bacterium]|nr:6-phosphogluconolactonase [Chlamydiales bacterium]
MIKNWDERRDIVILENKEKAISFSADQFLSIAKNAIQENDKFTVALSGGSTPKAIYEEVYAKGKNLDWSKVWLFWSDERAVPPTDPDSNYRMAMDSCFGKLPIPKKQIFRMEAEGDIRKKAKEYEKIIETHVGPDLFDLVMLGMGEDGHTASLFPETEALTIQGEAVAPNFVPKKNSFRMTLTFDCINNSSHISFYVFGAAKKEMVKRILLPPPKAPILPSELVGTTQQKALWILDQAAAEDLMIAIKHK